MDDYIKREAVRDILADEFRLANAKEEGVIGRINYRVKAIPAADVEEVRHGEWRDDADEIDKRFHRHDFFCKKCNTRADYFIGGEGNWWSSYAPNYCPNCGAKMTEV